MQSLEFDFKNLIYKQIKKVDTFSLMGRGKGENDDIKLTANIHLKNYVIWALKIMT